MQIITTVVIDELVILSNQAVLKTTHPSIHIVIPPSIIQSLNNPSNSDVRASLRREDLKLAIDARTVESGGIDLSVLAEPRGVVKPYADVIGQAMFVRARREPGEVFVVTDDSRMASYAASIGLGVWSSANYVSNVTAALDADKQALAREEAEIAAQLTAQRRYIAAGIVGGILLSFAAWLSWTFRFQILASTSVWGTATIILIAAIILYAIRGRQKLAYGVFEVLAGFFTTRAALIATLAAQTRSGNSSIDISTVLPILAGLYIMVRGLDNIGKALEATPGEKVWRRLSGEGAK